MSGGLHNLLICCGAIPEGGTPGCCDRCPRCGTPRQLCGHRDAEFTPTQPNCTYTTSTADYCHRHGGYLSDASGECDGRNERDERTP